MGPSSRHRRALRNVQGSFLSQSGLVAGRSQRFLGGTVSHGFVAWLYEDGATSRIGYYDAAHTSAAGDQNSLVVGINDAGVVIGNSSRYVSTPAGTQTGSTAWMAGFGTTARIGFAGGIFTSATGLESSSVTAINDAGQIVGQSSQYVSDSALGVPWLLDQGVYTTLGLTDAAHTRSDGYRSGSSAALNAAGDIAGRSAHYNGLVNVGTSVWLRHAGVTSRVGLTDGLFTSSSGQQFSDIFRITADGRAVGTSDFYVTGGPIGTATWIADGQGTARIGLFDAGYTSSAGQQLCYATGMSPNGNVIGRAIRYAGGQSSIGESAWLYSGGNSVRVGLVGPGYINGSGADYSQAQFVNDRGEVAGNSTIYTPQLSGGPAVWIYRGGQTIRIGLFDSAHTSPSSGSQNSNIIQLNARGDVIGSSARYVGPLIWNEAWYYDRATDTVMPLEFSVSSTGDTSSTPMLLTDDGVVYGRYSKYSGSTYLGDFVFRWSLTGGMQEMASLVEGGLSAEGWQTISSINGASTPGTWDHTTLVGLGRMTGDTQVSAFVLSVPPGCGSADFDCDGSIGTDQDIAAFFACLSGDCPAAPCRSTADFNGDSDVGTDADIDAFFRVLSGGAC